MAKNEASNTLLTDLPKGPLDRYRNQATFDWKEMKFLFEDPQLLKIKMKMWDTLSRDPLFQRPLLEPTTEEQKRRSARQLHRYLRYDFLQQDISILPYDKRMRLMMTLNEALAVAYPDTSVKHAVGVALIKNVLSTLGTERHKYILDAAWNKKLVGCLAITEIAHGSDTKLMRTTATYDEATQEFVVNTPDFEAAKCWAGNLGKTSTFAVLFAQLYTRGENHGLHAFIVPLRDPTTLLPYPGILVGDMGEKIGLNGIDNGFLLFKNYRIPRENMLNRTADVTPEGDYESSFSEPGKILGAALENLSTGRVCIMQDSVNTLINAVTIAIRYAALRKQFADNGKGIEIPIIEYELHQWRLFPHVATAAVLKVFVNSFTDVYLSAVNKSTSSDRLEDVNNLVSEVHSIISGAKPLITWCCRDATQECREACGGHGFLKASRLGDLKLINEPCVTYEGDNNVLVQQTSNWLLRQWNGATTNGGTTSPLRSCSYFENYRNITNSRFSERDVATPAFIEEAYEWLIVYMVKETNQKQIRLEELGHSKFESRNKSQVYLAAVLSRAYIEYCVLREFWGKIGGANSSLQIVLHQLGSLCALSNLDRHMVYFYQGGYTSSPRMAQLVKETILRLCDDLKPNIVGVIDALAPPDFVVNSILGKSDGKLYENLQSALFHNAGSLSRPEWWSEIIIEGAPDLTKVPHSKL